MPVTNVSTRVKRFRFHLSCGKYSAQRPDTPKFSSSAWKRSRFVWRFSFVRFSSFLSFFPSAQLPSPKKIKNRAPGTPPPLRLPPPPPIHHRDAATFLSSASSRKYTFEWTERGEDGELVMVDRVANEYNDRVRWGVGISNAYNITGGGTVVWEVEGL